MTGDEFTAKHFRTWRASALALEALVESDAPMGIAALGQHVADNLGNTPTIARKSYIHPAIVALAKDRDAQRQLKELPLPRATRWLTKYERGLLAVLEAAPASAKLLAA